MAKPKASQNKAKDVESVKRMLGIKDRFAINLLLPKEDNIINLMLVRDIATKVQFTQAEFKKYGIESQGDGNYKWPDDTHKKSISFTAAEIELLKRQIDLMDKQKKITPDLLSLCLELRG